jgi:hypothetical protein
MASTKNDLCWALYAVQLIQLEFADATPRGRLVVETDNVKCVLRGKVFNCLLTRMRAHVGGILGHYISACIGYSHTEIQTVIDKHKQCNTARLRSGVFM